VTCAEYRAIEVIVRLMFILFDAYLFELPKKFSQLWLVRDLNNRDGFYREGGAAFELGRREHVCHGCVDVTI
jgi:hypothetical protein